MGKDNTENYIQFPLCLLKETYKDTYQGVNLIINYGIINFSTKVQYSQKEVARQLYYDYYKRQPMLKKLINKIDKSANTNKIELDEDYHGFDISGKKFDPEITEILVLFDQDCDFKFMAIQHYQIRQAAQLLNVILGAIEPIIEDYEKATLLIEKFEEKYGKDACPGIKTSHLFDFRDNPEKADIFRAYIGIRSLIGQKDFIATNKQIILSRMIGAKSDIVRQEFLEITEIKPTYEKYKNRYQMDKLLLELSKRGFIIKVAYGRRLYISKNNLTYEELADKVASWLSKLNIRRQEREANHRLKQQLYKGSMT